MSSRLITFSCSTFSVSCLLFFISLKDTNSFESSSISSSSKVKGLAFSSGSGPKSTSGLNSAFLFLRSSAICSAFSPYSLIFSLVNSPTFLTGFEIPLIRLPRVKPVKIIISTNNITNSIINAAATLPPVIARKIPPIIAPNAPPPSILPSI